MAGLGILLYGLLRGIVGIGNAVENAKYMSEPYSHTEDGTPVYMDRNRNTYINGEKIVPHLDYKTMKTTYVGENSGKVYCDPEQNMRDRSDRWSEIRKQEAIKMGKLAYMKYDHDWQKEITCEISTGKYIAELKGETDGTYWKYYARNDKPEYRGQFYFGRDHKIDTPIQITQDEYDKLNISMGSHSAFDHVRYTLDNKLRYVWRSVPLIKKEDLPKVPGRN